MTSMICRIVELCVFRFVADRPEYLLLRRADSEPLYPGVWQIVTGSIEREEKAWEASLRELREETRFRAEHFWVVPHVSSFYDPGNDVVNVCPMFAAQVAPGSDPVLSREHQSFAWLAYRDAAARLVWPSQKRGLEIVHQELAGVAEAGRLTRLRVP
jgi:dihydroneopterin triphosphate diphosphatase